MSAALKVVDPFALPEQAQEEILRPETEPRATQAEEKPVTRRAIASLSDYLQRAPERFIRCRESVRHRYPDVPLAQRRFQRTHDGYDVWTVDCENCGAAYCEEVWLIVEGSGGLVVKMELISRKTNYYTDREESYLLPPGVGRVPGRTLYEHRVTEHFVGRKVRRSGRRSQGGT